MSISQTPVIAERPGVQLRVVAADETATWLRPLQLAFFNNDPIDEARLAAMAEVVATSRTLGWFDTANGACVATFRRFEHELTPVLGDPVPSAAVSSVTVAPTHRRRGLLRVAMVDELRRAKDEGYSHSGLIAAEYGIYGRFDYGPATRVRDLRIDVPRAGAIAEPAGGSFELVELDRLPEFGPQVHDAMRRRVPGMVSRTGLNWRRLARIVGARPADATAGRRLLVHRGQDGEVRGYAVHTAVSGDLNGQPTATITVEDLTGVDTAAERALWSCLINSDWVDTVIAPARAPDESVASVLANPRALAATASQDYQWIRPLDVSALLTQRGYAAPGELVLTVHDRDGLAGGTFRLATDGERTECLATRADPDIELDVAALGSLWLGGYSASEIAARGGLVPGPDRALDQRLLNRVSGLFSSDRAPWVRDAY